MTDEELMVRAQRDDALAFAELYVDGDRRQPRGRLLPGDGGHRPLLLRRADPSEIAIRLEIPTGTVKGRMRLGLAKLRGEWLLLEAEVSVE